MGTVPTTHRDGSELQPSHALRVAVYIDWQTLSHLDLDERRRTIFFLERTGNWCSSSAEIWDTLLCGPKLTVAAAQTVSGKFDLRFGYSASTVSRPGKGALCRHGKYWYPVRLLQKNPHTKTWRVKWRRGCDFGHYGPPNLEQEVEESDLVDELWNEREKRRAIRLGKWQLTCEIETPLDQLTNFQSPSHAYTKEIDAMLRPYRLLLQLLLDFSFEGPDKDRLPDGLVVPCVNVIKQRIEARRNSGAQIHRSLRFAEHMITEYGDISHETHAQILNWIYNEVPGAKDGVRWFQHVADTHAVTIFIAATKRDGFEKDADYPRAGTHDEIRNFLWQKAWEYQCEHFVPFEPPGVDVDQECISLFENRLFENSKQSGKAGNEQRGLDVGSLQGGFYPYHPDPSWDKKDYEESESEFIS
ncbi:hypothetical protein D9613_006555 [Agrocybe pediades]|uniref:Uncharacterized protein n=1 Tax=Agrocybe pediades TaxID=84607 RepID=A0A8H4VI93_9AGAR|nr:hypothetical protein D9613_006555 [Agrocybe pediades]